jgi:hypothetical protein
MDTLSSAEQAADDFVTGFATGVKDMAQAAMLLARVIPGTPMWAASMAIDPEGTAKLQEQFAKGLAHMVEHPVDALGNMIDIKDLQSGDYAKWLGHLTPDVIITVLTMGGGGAAAAAGEGVAKTAAETTAEQVAKRVAEDVAKTGTETIDAESFSGAGESGLGRITSAATGIDEAGISVSARHVAQASIRGEETEAAAAAASAAGAARGTPRWAREPLHPPDRPLPTGDDVRPIHSVYGDGTAVSAGRQPRRLGAPSPDPLASGPHVRLRWDDLNGRVYQAREFDELGHPIRDIDFTAPTFPNGAMRPHHSIPEQHLWRVNDSRIGPSSGWVRGPGRPMSPPPP